MNGPYAAAADTYWSAGWRSILPLPAKAKKHPPKGYTGAAGAVPSYPDIRAWADEHEGSGNICLRLPPNIIGIDVDDYGDKAGGTTLALAEAALGKLPSTWRTTSRDDGVSGIRLYRVPEGLAWPGEIGPAVEIIQAGHRYALVWPSIHPEGGTYRWINAAGIVSTSVPDPDDIVDMPEAWVAEYTGGVMAVETPRVEVRHQEAVAWLAGRTHATEDMCPRMVKALDQHSVALAGSAHDATVAATLRVARLADEGHHGAVHALAAVRQAFLSNVTDPNRSLIGSHRRTDPEAQREFSDMVASAVGVVLGAPTGVTTCDCYGQLTGLATTTAAPPAVAAPAIDGATALDPMPVAAQQPDPDPGDDSPARFKDGATFILDAPASLPNIWGDGDDSLWAEGEALMVCGPPGVGKTTLTGQLVRGLLGLQHGVLGLPVREHRRVLYLAMDRPAQIARGLRRAFHEHERPTLTERLLFWEGPPPGDVAKHPTVLLSLAQLAEADVIIIDSVKDAAVGLSEDEVAAAYNRARQNCLANGVQVLELHHMVKRGVGGNKPKELADVYGSAWLTAGAGSVVLLWGAAGDPIVEMIHLKQPAAEVGPWRLMHDHNAGTTSIFRGVDLIQTVAAAGVDGVTASAVAAMLFDVEKPTEAQKQKARARLDKLVEGGHVTCEEAPRGVLGGRPTKVYRSNHGATTTPFLETATTSNHEQPRDTPISRSSSNHESNHGNHNPIATTNAPPSKRGSVFAAPSGPAPKRGETLDCNGCGLRFNAKAIHDGRGYCANCAKERA